MLWAVIASYLVFRVWQALGERGGFQRRPPRKGTSVSLNQNDVQVEKKPLKRKREEPLLDTSSFLRGAEKAFRVVLDAYLGDRERPFFCQEAAWQSLEQVYRVRPKNARLLSVSLDKDPALDGNMVKAFVRVVSVCTFNDGIRECEELWCFERALDAQTPNWNLFHIERTRETPLEP